MHILCVAVSLSLVFFCYLYRYFTFLSPFFCPAFLPPYHICRTPRSMATGNETSSTSLAAQFAQLLAIQENQARTDNQLAEFRAEMPGRCRHQSAEVREARVSVTETRSRRPSTRRWRRVWWTPKLSCPPWAVCLPSNVPARPLKKVCGFPPSGRN